MLAREGVDIAFSARDQTDIDKTISNLKKKHVIVIGEVVDAADSAQTIAWIENVGAIMGGIDIVISPQFRRSTLASLLQCRLNSLWIQCAS